ncbi:MAG: hypothetical protein WDN29_10755 [Methylovirgula sp.]
MNKETIEAARNALRQRIAEADEAEAAFKAAANKTARRIAQDILQSRTLSVTQSTIFLAVCMNAAKGLSLIPTFHQTVNDMAFVSSLFNRAKNFGALPAYLSALTSNPEFQMVPEIAPEATRTAKKQIDDLLKRLKSNPAAELV